MFDTFVKVLPKRRPGLIPYRETILPGKITPDIPGKARPGYVTMHERE